MIWALLMWVPILAFAAFRSERRSTRFFLVGAIVLNLAGASWMWLAADANRFNAFERFWQQGTDPSPHAD